MIKTYEERAWISENLLLKYGTTYRDALIGKLLTHAADKITAEGNLVISTVFSISGEDGVSEDLEKSPAQYLSKQVRVVVTYTDNEKAQ